MKKPARKHAIADIHIWPAEGSTLSHNAALLVATFEEIEPGGVVLEDLTRAMQSVFENLPAFTDAEAARIFARVEAVS